MLRAKNIYSICDVCGFEGKSWWIIKFGQKWERDPFSFQYLNQSKYREMKISISGKI